MASSSLAFAASSCAWALATASDAGLADWLVGPLGDAVAAGAGEETAQLDTEMNWGTANVTATSETAARRAGKDVWSWDMGSTFRRRDR